MEILLLILVSTIVGAIVIPMLMGILMWAAIAVIGFFTLAGIGALFGVI